MEQSGSFRLRHEVIAFFGMTFLLTWLLWVPAFLIQNHGVPVKLSGDFLITAGTFAPSIAGFFLTYRFGGKAEAASLLKTLLHVRIGVKSLLLVFLVLPAVSGVSCLIFYLFEGALPQMQFAPWFLPVAFVYILLLMGPLGEEAGWRGFALKKMLQLTSPVKAAVLLGIIWSFWHLPLFFINGTTQNALTAFGILPAIAGYSLYTVCISVLMTMLYLTSSGSVFACMLLHGVGNLSLGVVPIVFSKSGAVILLLTLCAAVTALTCKFKKMLHKD